MTYTSYDGTARLCIATSVDLIHWEKQGPAFSDGRFAKAWSKSGSIVVRPVSDGRGGAELVATRLSVDGLFRMYWGENSIYSATSNDLVKWDVVLGGDRAYRGRPEQRSGAPGASPMEVFAPRPGSFDSELVEPGPPAILLPSGAGILLIYNSKVRTNSELWSRVGYSWILYASGFCVLQQKINQFEPRAEQMVHGQSQRRMPQR